MDTMWFYNEKGHLRSDVYDKTQLIGEYESRKKTPYSESITSYFGDMGLYELKSGVTEETFNKKYMECVCELTKPIVVKNLEDTVINSIIEKCLYKGEKAGSKYRLGLKAYTEKFLKHFYEFAKEEFAIFSEKEILDCWCRGNLPSLELEIYFSSTEENKITLISIYYYFDDQEMIGELDKEEIEILTPIINAFIEKYDKYAPDNIECGYGDDEYADSIPLKIRNEWYLS